MNNFTIFQGSTAYIDAETLSSVFAMTDGTNKYTSSDVISTEEGLKIVLDSSLTSGFVPRSYDYQVVNPNGLEQQGKLKVKPNLMYSDSVESYWKTVIRAIDDRLAGRASEAASSIAVGDKHISYMTLDELLKLREFASQRLAEEEEDEAASPNNEKTMKYNWVLY